jgi:hypothetical protein
LSSIPVEWARILNSASRARSVVGLALNQAGGLMARPLYFPPMIRMTKQGAGWTHF